jgi:hypothetical protein
MRIIYLASFWCTARNASQLFKLTIVLLQRIEELPLQVEDNQWMRAFKGRPIASLDETKF